MPVAAIPKVPVAKPVSAQTKGEFEALKSSLEAIASWDLSPTELIPIHMAGKADESQSRAFFNAISV